MKNDAHAKGWEKYMLSMDGGMTRPERVVVFLAPLLPLLAAPGESVPRAITTPGRLTMDTDKRRRTTRRAPRPPASRRGGGKSMTPFEEVGNVERLVGPHRLRSLPWHLIFRKQLQDGTASPQLVKAAERARREWDLANVPTMAPAPNTPAPGPASRASLHQARSSRRTT